jgi:hypothetical protein
MVRPGGKVWVGAMGGVGSCFVPGAHLVLSYLVVVLDVMVSESGERLHVQGGRIRSERIGPEPYVMVSR